MMRAFCTAACTAALALAWAMPASAQSADDQPRTAAPARATVEPIHTGLLFSPGARFGEIDGRWATFVGGEIGWITDDTLFVGGAGYLLANRSDDFEMAYGGLVVAWMFGGAGPISVGVKGLVGAGTVTLSDEVVVFGRVGPPAGRPGFGGSRPSAGAGAMSTNVRYYFDERFLIAEPQTTVVWRITRWMALDGSVGYRVIGRARGVEDRLRGVSGSVGIRFGR